VRPPAATAMAHDKGNAMRGAGSSTPRMPRVPIKRPQTNSKALKPLVTSFDQWFQTRCRNVLTCGRIPKEGISPSASWCQQSDNRHCEEPEGRRGNLVRPASARHEIASRSRPQAGSVGSQ
jgi:hypothetical protein